MVKRSPAPAAFPDVPPRAAGWALLVLSAAGVLAYHAAVFFPGWADENVHLYVTERLRDGATLYGDIHSARPPLSFALPVLLRALGVPSLLTARAVVLLGVLASAGLVVWAGRRFWGARAGVAAGMMLLLAPETVQRHAFTGIHMVGLFTALSVVLALEERASWAGVAAGVALLHGQHALVMLGALLLLLALRSRREALRALGGLLGVVVAVLGTVWLRGGTGVFQDLLGQHLYHLRGGEAAARTDLGWWVASWSLDQSVVLAGAVAALLLGKTLPDRSPWVHRWGPTPVLALLVALHGAAVLTMTGGQILYISAGFPLLALLAGAGASRVLSRLAGKQALVVTAAAGLLLGGGAASTALYNRRDNARYPWVAPLRFARMAHVQRLAVLEDLGALVRAESPPEATVFGVSTLATAVALHAQRRVAGELADLPTRWIELGQVSRQDVLERIEADRVGLFLTPRWFYTQDRVFSEYLQRCYDAPRVIPRRRGDGSGLPDFLVYRHRDGPRPCR